MKIITNLKNNGQKESFADCLSQSLGDCADAFEEKINDKIKDSEDRINKDVEDKISKLLDKLLTPGLILAFSAERAPKGWLPCDGAAVSRKKYADLFEVVDTQFGDGDGETTFNVPDLRGQFLRGYPGSQYDPRREFGSKQDDAIRDIEGGFGRLVYASSTGTIYEIDNHGGGSIGNRKWTAGAHQIDASQGYSNIVKILNSIPQQVMSAHSKYPKAFQFKASNVVPTAHENRPVNTSLLFCIKT